MESKQLTPSQAAGRRKWVVALTAVKCLIESATKLIFAYFTGSAGLLADAIHSMTDVAGSLVVWVGIRVSNNKYRRFTYGFYKIENLLAMTIGVAILYAAYELALGFVHSKSVMPTNVTTSIMALLLLIAVNFLWGRFEVKTGQLINSPGIEASGKHTFTDLYSSIAVLVGLVGAEFGVNLDKWASLFVAVILIKVGYVIIWDNLKVLLDISLEDEMLREYTAVIQKIPGVVSVKSIRGRNSGSYRLINVEININTFDLASAEEIASNIEKAVKQYDNSIDTVFVHYTKELPSVLKVFIPTELNGDVISEHFGKAQFMTTLTYDKQSMRFYDVKTELNPFMKTEKGRGKQMVEHIKKNSVDSVCTKENLQEKGPGLMLYHHGIDTRITELTSVSELLQDYVGNSRAIFAERGN
ncbi:cation diffusion facilitator family transporter [Candidatus Magnetomonas plexicatena]|uniref:cation diffusion facilitator family transporter n=1 Tax=Candidatus Magnetomonas plexicatena TaxID=2552947 RepID=UPI001104426A|nr:cation diffusion facilitator family transporter [Nitrospirales bacterium LBB_01]